MNETVKEWLEKAEGDYRTASRELGATDGPNFDAVCFHAQQCVEKTLKGVLVAHAITPPRTHDLLHLAELLRNKAPSWEFERSELRFLSQGSIAFRYPGESATPDQAAKALAICGGLHTRLLKLIQEG